MELSFCYQRPKLKEFLCSKGVKCMLMFAFFIIIIIFYYFQICLKPAPPRRLKSKIFNKGSPQSNQLFSFDSNFQSKDAGNNIYESVDVKYNPSSVKTQRTQRKQCIKGIGVSTGRRYNTLDISAKDFIERQRNDESDSTDNRNESSRKLQLPKAIVIGFAKAGTSALVSFLELNSAIRTAKREVHFFDIDSNYEEGYKWYQSQMPFSGPDQITMEKTPSYIMMDTVPERIHIMNSSIRIIVTVKEPVNRAISEYSKLYVEGKVKGKSFKDLVIDRKTGKVNSNYKPIKRSMYYLHMLKWFCYFKRDQIHLVDGDNLVHNPVSELNKLETFLGLEKQITDEMVFFNRTKGFYCMQQNKNKPPKCLPPKKGRKHQPVKLRDIKALKGFYRPWNEKFFKLMGQHFNW